jgi:hypothetical protein
MANVLTSAGWVVDDGIPAKASLGGNLLGVLGDSFLAKWQNAPTATSQATSPDSSLGWALNLAMRRLYPIYVGAVGGSAFTPAGVSASGTLINDQIPGLIASGATHAVIMGGVNDFLAGSSLSAVQTAYLAAIQELIAAGIKVWVWTQPTVNAAYTFYTVTMQAKLFELNRWLKTRVATQFAENNVVVVDVAGATVDPLSATGDHKATGAADNIHPNNLSGYWGGKEAARIWNLFIPPVPAFVVSNADNYGYSSTVSNLVDNSLMVTGGLGVVTPTGFTVVNSGTGTPTSVLTTVTRTDGVGYDSQIAVTSNALNDQTIFKTADVKARCAVGDTLIVQVEITATVVTVLKWLQLGLYVDGAIYNFSSIDMSIGGPDVPLPEAPFTMLMQTPPYTIPAAQGTISRVMAELNIRASAAGAMTVKVSKYSIIKLPTL